VCLGGAFYMIIKSALDSYCSYINYLIDSKAYLTHLLNVPHMPAIHIPEDISRFLPHLREDSMEHVIDREQPHCVIII
jgi:hypothetical protein